MKMNRLMLLAMSFGMIATSVSAASTNRPVEYKGFSEASNVVWSGIEDVVKVELGGKLILPSNVKVSATLEGRTTDRSESKDGKCYVGLSNELGRDSNRDGMVDTPLYVLAEGWAKDEATYFESEADAVKYLKGLMIEGTGKEQSGYQLAKNIKKGSKVLLEAGFYSLDDVDEIIDALEEAELLEPYYEVDEDGSKELIGYDLQRTTFTVSRKDYKDQFLRIKVTDSYYSRFDEEELKEAVLMYLAGDRDWDMVGTRLAFEAEYLEQFYVTKAESEDPTPYVIGNDVFDVEAMDEYVALFYTSYSKGGKVLDSTEFTKFKLQEKDQLVYFDEDGEPLLNDAGYAALPGEQKEDGTVIFNKNDDDITPLRLNAGDLMEIYIEKNDIDYNKIKVKEHGVGLESEFVWSDDAEGFVRVEKAPVTATDDADIEKDIAAADFELSEDFGSWEYIETPNLKKGEFYLPIYLENYVSVSSRYETMKFEDIYGDIIEVNAFKADNGKWYPVLQEDEIDEFLYLVGAVKEADSAWFNEHEDDLKPGVRTWIDGSKNEEYLPKNYLDAPSAEQCTYKTSDTKSSDLTITHDGSKIDTSKSGVHTVTYEAKDSKGNVVASKETKVVIAPKYERIYKGGKVVNLKAYHLNGNLYANYDYDWDKKEVTVTYYSLEGGNVESIITSSL